jgi:hypothetical protein
MLTFLFVFAVYPVFVVIAVVQAPQVAAFLWIAFSGLALLLLLVADRLLSPQQERRSWIQALRIVGAPASAGIPQQAAEVVPESWSPDQTHDRRRQALEPVETTLGALDGPALEASHHGS